MENTENLSMPLLAEGDQPRYKLLNKGYSVLSDSELVSLLITSGSRTETAVTLSKRIMASVHNNLNELSKLTVNDFKKFRGMGEAKALSIIAAIELGRRRKNSLACKRERITTSKDAYELFKPLLMDLPHEEFWVAFLNRSNYVLKKEMISRGGVSGTVVDCKILFKSAVESLASSVILCHNHPSGNTKASDQDIQITKKLKEAGKLLEIPVIDHIIIGEGGYFSFADDWKLEC